MGKVITALSHLPANKFRAGVGRAVEQFRQGISWMLAAVLEHGSIKESLKAIEPLVLK